MCERKVELKWSCMAPDTQMEVRARGNAASTIGLRSLFPEILIAPAPRGIPVLHGMPVLRPMGSVARLASTGWSDLAFDGRRGAPQATVAGQAPASGLGLAFGPGVLRPPAASPGTWASSTIPFAWTGMIRRPGLAERLLPLGIPGDYRSDAVANAVLADRLGGSSPSRLHRMNPGQARSFDRILTGRTILIEGVDPVQDLASLRRLLQAQLADTLLVLVRSRHGRLARAALGAGVAVAPEVDVPIWDIVDAADTMHVPLGHDVAVLARLAGRPVFTDGVRAAACTPGSIASAYLVHGTRYLDPASGKAIACEAFIDRMLEWRRLEAKMPRIACFVGISFWKRRRMAEFAGGQPRFTRSAARAVRIAQRSGGAVAVWPSRAPAGLDAAASAASVAVMRVEDGFIRSRGLGADFIPPASVIIDGRGIYYDARRPSDLEALLSDQAFTPELLARARRLRDVLVARGVTKYNLGGAQLALEQTAGRRRILVPGQVADDLSVLAGGAGIAPGLPLLREVRQRNPDAFILYKPHPDVEAGHRRGAVPDIEALASADLIVRGVSMDSLIGAVNEIHTLTSLTGFEALLRGRAVTTYGRPFYSGWGLTTDVHPPAGRTRRLSLDELVAATLILYPHYIDPVTGLRCGPEQLIDRLDQVADGRTGLLVGLRRSQGTARRALGKLLGGKPVRRIAEPA